ncbi:WD40 repeat domain-containing protein [Streptomyces cellulosae]|uniref:WD40 repeat domain-containing protein n=1 Tax=Streptomyces TaxID=1883 RepID=UPI00136AC1DE|nr:WD40 repeat domain-containing protein [Streptomyces sp. McG7]MCX4481117.1 WD40 repeat domain-containing protein [Streptomyces cellulosae]MXQ61702.1 WD40 repeat domain-containing protein [Streptomyces sp. XHT-2]WSB46455.1 WD40 repeat domain-containing protein [Streptomyces cellulosae]
MTSTDRIVRIVYAEGAGLLASDTHGRVHLLDERLTPVASSPFVPEGRPLYGLAVAGGWVIGKDRMGAVYRWSLDTLDLVDRLDPATVCDRSTLRPREEPSPCSSRGIGVWRDRVWVTSGYHRQMLVLDLHTFEVLEIRPNVCGDSPMEWACTEHPVRHAVSDKHGNLRFGSFETGAFPEVVKLDEGNIHRVRYDARHDRFWATQDFGAGDNADVANGVVVVSPAGEKEDELLFARDDVEFVAFSPDHARAYAGGFDGELNIFDNTRRELRVERTVTGFPHQLGDLTVGPEGQVYVLCQDGTIVELDAAGDLVRDNGQRRQAVWDLQPSREDPRTLYCATDSGVSVVRVADSAAGPMIRPEAEHVTGWGFTRRVASVEGGLVGITRDRFVFRADRDGTPRWRLRLPDLLHTVAVSPDGTRALVATNGGAVELDTADGSRRASLGVDGLPVWATAYLQDGARVLITRNGVIAVLDPEGPRVRWRFDQGEYPKRAWTQDGRLYVVGDGGLKEIEVGVGVAARWSKLLSNTVENAVVSDGLVVASSYGMQLASYDHAGVTFAGLLEDLPDYPKALAVVRDAQDAPHLLVGCRTGLLSLYRMDPGARGRRGRPVLAKLRDHWLPRHRVRFALEHRDARDTVPAGAAG